MGRATFLADRCAFARVSQPNVSVAFAPLIAECQVALCARPGPDERLQVDTRHVVTGSLEHTQRAPTKTLVELEPHATSSRSANRALASCAA